MLPMSQTKLGSIHSAIIKDPGKAYVTNDVVVIGEFKIRVCHVDTPAK